VIVPVRATAIRDGRLGSAKRRMTLSAPGPGCELSARGRQGLARRLAGLDRSALAAGDSTRGNMRRHSEAPLAILLNLDLAVPGRLAESSEAVGDFRRPRHRLLPRQEVQVQEGEGNGHPVEP
jgi:hypothetical protein